MTEHGGKDALSLLFGDPADDPTPVMGVMVNGKVELTVEGALGGFDQRNHGERYDLSADNVPPPSRAVRWDGLCNFLPTPWAERERTRMSVMRNCQALCLSCHAHLVHGRYADGLVALAHASDHDRAEVDHQIVVLDGNDRLVCRNTYHPLRPCGSK